MAGGSGYFIKQAPPEERGPDSPLAVEASVYRWAAAHQDGERLRSFLPRSIHYDQDASILVLELLPAPVGDASVSTESYLQGARMLAAAHRVNRSGPEPTLELSTTAPWVFDITRPLPASLRELSPAQLSLFQSLQSSPPLTLALDRMRESWSPECLIHGDFKWTNLAGGKLLDWELAQWGDPAWDVGGAMHAAIVEDLLAAELPGDVGPERLFGILGGLLARRHEDHRAFWSGYSADRGVELRQRLPSQTGLRFIKTAYEWCQSETRMPRRAAAILQLGINMVLRPEEALQAVLGLS